MRTEALSYCESIHALDVNMIALSCFLNVYAPELQGDPEAVRRIGLAVEDLGYDHLLACDHVLGATHDREPKLRDLCGPKSRLMGSKSRLMGSPTCGHFVATTAHADLSSRSHC